MWRFLTQIRSRGGASDQHESLDQRRPTVIWTTAIYRPTTLDEMWLLCQSVCAYCRLINYDWSCRPTLILQRAINNVGDVFESHAVKWWINLNKVYYTCRPCGIVMASKPLCIGARPIPRRIPNLFLFWSETNRRRRYQSQ